MQNTIILIGIICAVLAVALRPRYALAVYIIELLWFPEYLRFSIGTIDISVGRIVVAVLLIRCLSNDQIRSRFRWSQLDKLVALSMLVYIGIPLLTQPSFATLENRSGFLMDTWLAYMVTRLIITDRTKLICVIKCISIALIPLAFLGCMEAVTGWQPFVPLRRFIPWAPTTGEVTREVTRTVRWGLTRAVGPFSHPILFGSGLAMFLPLIYYLHHEKNYWRRLAYPLSAVTIVGALSSMSSGPWIMVIVIVFCLAMERYKQWAKPMIIFFILSCVFIEFFSNRTFYHVVFSYASMLGGAGWHRARMIDLAISHFGEWWLAGYGTRTINWGMFSSARGTDVTNQYLVVGLRYGLIGMILLCVVLFTAFRGLVSAHKKVKHPVMKSLYWALGSILFSVAIVWTSVSFFGQLMPLFYCVLGIIGSCFLFTIDLKNKRKKLIAVNSGKYVSGN